MGYYAYYQYVKEMIYKYHKSEICNDVSNLQSCNYLCVSENCRIEGGIADFPDG